MPPPAGQSGGSPGCSIGWKLQNVGGGAEAHRGRHLRHLRAVARGDRLRRRRRTGRSGSGRRGRCRTAPARPRGPRSRSRDAGRRSWRGSRCARPWSCRCRRPCGRCRCHRPRAARSRGSARPSSCARRRRPRSRRCRSRRSRSAGSPKQVGFQRSRMAPPKAGSSSPESQRNEFSVPTFRTMRRGRGQAGLDERRRRRSRPARWGWPRSSRGSGSPWAARRR